MACATTIAKISEGMRIMLAFATDVISVTLRIFLFGQLVNFTHQTG